MVPLPPAEHPRDIPLTVLRMAELLLIVTLRLFALPRCEPGRRPRKWQAGLEAARLTPSQIDAACRLFGIVCVATRQPLDIRCRRGVVLGRDEARLLQVLSLIQHGRSDEAEVQLGTWLLPTAQRLAVAPAQELSVALLRVGVVIPLRNGDAASILRTMPVHANRGLALLH